jgi:hypothetical protein
VGVGWGWTGRKAEASVPLCNCDCHSSIFASYSLFLRLCLLGCRMDLWFGLLLGECRVGGCPGKARAWLCRQILGQGGGGTLQFWVAARGWNICTAAPRWSPGTPGPSPASTLSPINWVPWAHLPSWAQFLPFWRGETCAQDIQLISGWGLLVLFVVPLWHFLGRPHGIPDAPPPSLS